MAEEVAVGAAADGAAFVVVLGAGEVAAGAGAVVSPVVGAGAASVDVPVVDGVVAASVGVVAEPVVPVAVVSVPVVSVPVVPVPVVLVDDVSAGATAEVGSSTAKAAVEVKTPSPVVRPMSATVVPSAQARRVEEVLRCTGPPGVRSGRVPDRENPPRISACSDRTGTGTRLRAEFPKCDLGWGSGAGTARLVA
ncbi:hypothetical protein GCM10017712_26730 [Curtobacterium citreum]